MDNSVPKNQSNSCVTDAEKQVADKKVPDVLTKKESTASDVNIGDQSVIEIEKKIPTVEVMDVTPVSNEDSAQDGKQKNVKMALTSTPIKSDPTWLNKYEICEELAEVEDNVGKTDIKTEPNVEEADPKQAGEAKQGKVKNDSCVTDTLILQIDATDNLDVSIDNGDCKDQHDTSESKTDENLSSEIKNENEKQLGGKKAGKKAANKKVGRKSKAKKAIETKVAKVKNEDNQEAESTEEKPDVTESKENLRKKIKLEQEKTDEMKTKDSLDAETANPDIVTKVEQVEEKPDIQELNNKNNQDKFEKLDDKKIEPRFIWISNITKTTRATDLKLHLSSYGKVQTARIVTDGKLYYGYVVMEKREDVDNCIKHLDDTFFENRKIRLSNKRPEKKSNKNVDQDANEKNETESPELKDDKSDKASIKERSKRNNEDKLPIEKPRRADPLTLKVKKDKMTCDEYFEERRRRINEEIFRKNRERRSQEQRELLRRRREMEREREERKRQRIRDEERRETEMKLERERRKLEQERKNIEKERFELIRLQKKLAETERSLLSRQKIELERDLQSMHEGLKKRRSADDIDRKSKFVRPEIVQPRIVQDGKDYWKSERDRRSPLKEKVDCLGINTYPKKVIRDESSCVAPPPPILSDNFDLSDRRRKDKDREWDSRNYDKKPSYPERQTFKETKSFERKIEDNRDYSYADRRENFQEKSYLPRDRYKPKDFGKYEKPQATIWEKNSPGTYKNVSGSWRNETTRPLHRHPTQEFSTTQFGSMTGVPHYYQQPEYGRATDFYGRLPDRKY